MTDRDIDWVRVEAFLVFVWRLCLRYDGSVTSGCRSTARNESVGGHPKSKHTFAGGWGMGLDVMLEDPAKRELVAQDCRVEGYHPVIKANYAPGQIHIQGWAYGQTPDW